METVRQPRGAKCGGGSGPRNGHGRGEHSIAQSMYHGDHHQQKRVLEDGAQMVAEQRVVANGQADGVDGVGTIRVAEELP